MLTLSSLYPSEARPRHGIFVENRLAKLVESGEVCARVIAPVPWFPFTAGVFGEYARYAATPRAERRRGIDRRIPPLSDGAVRLDNVATDIGRVGGWHAPLQRPRRWF